MQLGAVEDAIHGYLACVSYADAMLGRLLDAIDSGPNADNTIVVLWSDHGYHHGEKSDWGKHTLWQRTSQVPLIWAGPKIASGAEVAETVSLVDLYPTLAELCGVTGREEHDGVSLATTLHDPSAAPERTVLLPGMQPDEYAVINRDWRYIRYEDGGEELYDLKADPREWWNLASSAEHAGKLAELAANRPAAFAQPGPTRDQLQLLLDDESFRWAPRRSGDR